MSESPVLRWGIIATGWISDKFVTDLLAPRKNGPVKHIITALGSSSIEKGDAFVEKAWKDSSAPKPKVYARYQEVYDDSNVDIVYIGTPHALHKQNCLDAIASGKNILCEKPFTINEQEAQEVIQAAKVQGVFAMEAVWTRFFPLMRELHEYLYVKKAIGDVQRLFIDFSKRMSLADLPSNSRLKDPALGAGALLDIGIYNLTYASLVMGAGRVGKEHPHNQVASMLDLEDGIDVNNVVLLKYDADNEAGLGTRTAICTSSLNISPNNKDFARIEGTDGTIFISGIAVSCPNQLRIVKSGSGDANSEVEEQILEFPHPEGTNGFIYEADAVASDIFNGRNENSSMPLDETLRIMRLMDSIRKAGGLVYLQDTA